MTYKLAVMGNPVGHSLSPVIHEKFAQLAGIDLTYEKILVPQDAFASMAKRFFDEGGWGLNVTVPHKDAAFTFADEVSTGAELAKAVNTLMLARGESGEPKPRDEYQIRGENTDGTGLLRDLQRNLSWSISGGRILILGAGGAVQGVLKNLIDEEPKQIVIANRTLARAQSLIENITSSLHNIDEPKSNPQSTDMAAIALTELRDQPAFDLIISASSAGLAGDNGAEQMLGENLTHSATCCYDMIYGKPTPFLQWAKKLPEGQRSDGFGMLVEQAAKSFELWFDQRVETQTVLRDLSQTVGRTI